MEICVHLALGFAQRAWRDGSDEVPNVIIGVRQQFVRWQHGTHESQRECFFSQKYATGQEQLACARKANQPWEQPRKSKLGRKIKLPMTRSQLCSCRGKAYVSVAGD